MTTIDNHQLVKELQAKIKEIVNDELLQDLPIKPSLEDLDTLIAIEQGRAYNIKIQRDPLSPIYVTVNQSSTVLDIKHLIKAQLEKIKRSEKSGRKRKISWKYIWRSYCLLHDNNRLLNDNAIVSQLGIRQNSVLKFSRLAHEKGQHRKSWHH